MFCLFSRLISLGFVLSCILVITFVVLFSTMSVASSSPPNGLSQQPMIEQSPSEPPLPNEPTFSEHLFLPQVSKTGPGSEEHSPQEALHIADADDKSERIPPPIANLSTFVSNIGGDLDQYLNHAQTLDGKLTFTIAVTAPVLPERAIDPFGGFLDPSFAITLTNQHVLPKQAMLVLGIWETSMV